MARKGKMSSIRWRNYKRKDLRIRDTSIEKILDEEQEKERKPKRRRKVNGEWVVV